MPNVGKECKVKNVGEYKKLSLIRSTWVQQHKNGVHEKKKTVMVKKVSEMKTREKQQWKSPEQMHSTMKTPENNSKNQWWNENTWRNRDEKP